MLKATILAAVAGLAAAVNEPSAALLAQLEADPAVTLHPDGFYYKVIVEGNLSRPTATADSPITLSYRANTTDGVTFDGADSRNGFSSAMFPGFRAVLEAMPPGAKWDVYIPPEIGYGDANYGDVPAGSVLSLTVELHDVHEIPTGVWAVYTWMKRNPFMVLVLFIGSKMVLDFILGTPGPGGAQTPLKDVQGKESNPRIAFNVSIDGAAAGQVVAELFVDVVPKTADLFTQASCGEPKNKKKKKAAPEYKYKSVALEGVALGRLHFQSPLKLGKAAPLASLIGHPEYTKGYVSHDNQYLLSLANARWLSEEAPLEFFITLGRAVHLDGQHIVFGSVVEGRALVDKIENARRDDTEVTITKVRQVLAKKAE